MFVPILRALVGSTFLVEQDIVSIDYSFSRNSIASATVTTIKPIAAAPESSVVLFATNIDSNRVWTVFTGYIDRIEYDAVQKTYTIYARDVLKKALDTFLLQEVKFGIDVEQQKYYYSTYTDRYGGTFTVHEYSSLSALHAAHPETVSNITYEGVKAHAVVQWLLVMCGIPEQTSIQVAESNYFIGDITPVTFYLVSVYDAIQQIADLLGWDFYADREGVCRFHPSFANATGDVCVIQQNIVLQASYVSSNEELRNYVEVVGASGITARARSASPYLGSTPYRGVLIANEFIDTQDMAHYFAHRALHELNRLKRVYSLTILPIFINSINTALRVPFLTPAPNTLLRIESLTGSYSAQNGYTLSIQAVENIEDFTYDVPELFVLTDFSVQYLLTVGDPRVICMLDASISSSTSAEIVFYQWTIQHVSGTETLTGKQVFVTFDEAQLRSGGVTVTLLVRDDMLNTGTITKVLTYEDVVGSAGIPKYRVLYAAGSVGTSVSIDGGNTWLTVPLPSQHVAPSHYDILSSSSVENAYVLIVGTDGALYRSDDLLQTYPQVVPPSSVVYAAVSASDPLICYYATTSSLYRSVDGGRTFSHVFSFSDAQFGNVRMFDVDRNASELVYVCCAPSSTYPHGALLMLNSSNGGFLDVWPEWISSNEQPVFYVGGGYGSFSDTLSGGVQWVRTTQGVTAVLSGRKTHYAGDIVAITPDLTDFKVAHVVFSSGDYGDLVLSTSFNHLVLTYTSNGTTNVSIPFALRDGSASPVLYYASSDGVRKSVTRHQTIELLGAIGACTHVAYGPFVAPTKHTTALVVWAHPLKNTNYDPLYAVSSLRSSLFVATAPSGVLGESYVTATSGFICVQRPNHIGSITVTDVHAGHVVGYATNSNNAITLASPYYVHTYDTDRYPSVPIVYTPFVSGFALSSGLFQAASGLCIPSIQAFTEYVVERVQPRSLLISQRSVPSLITIARVTPPPFNTTGQFHREFLCGVHAFPSGIYQGVPASLQAPTYLLADQQLPPRGQAGLESRLRYDVAGVTTVCPSTQSFVVSVRGHLSQNKNHVVHVHATPNVTETVTSADLESPQDIIPVTKFAAISYSIARHVVSNQYYLVTNKSSGLTPLSWPVPDYQGAAQQIVAVHASRKHLSDVVYYATQSTLYRVSNYGQGTATPIFVVPSGIAPSVVDNTIVGGINKMSVTTDSALQRDYLTLVLSLPSSAQSGYIVVSTDEGMTWRYHKWEGLYATSVIHGAWFVVA